MSSVLLVFVLAAAAAPPAARPRPTPTPTPPPVLEGVVKGPDGKPINQARVYAESARPPMFFGMDPPMHTQTDAGGRFRLPLRAAGAHTVRVEAAGLAAQTLEKVVPGTPLTVTLGKGGTITGVVRDTSTGTPVPRVIVEARAQGRSVYAGWQPDAGVVRAETDAQGAFKLEGISPGLHTLTARGRGFDAARRQDVRPGTRVELYLFPGSTLS